MILPRLRRLWRPQTDHPRVLAEGRLTRVRVFTRGDLDRWIDWPTHDDPLFESYNPPDMTPRQRDHYHLSRRDVHDGRQFAVDNLNGDLVGRITLREIDWRLGHAVLGVSFHPRMLGQGLGTDGLIAFLDYYFGPLRMQTLFLDVTAFNVRAQRVYRKLGFRQCGERWGDPQPDTPGVFRLARFADIRHLFVYERGKIRPLVYDMTLRRVEWHRRRADLDTAQQTSAAGARSLVLQDG